MDKPPVTVVLDAVTLRMIRSEAQRAEDAAARSLVHVQRDIASNSVTEHTVRMLADVVTQQNRASAIRETLGMVVSVAT